MTNEDISTTEAARRLGIKPRTIQKWIEQGIIKAYRLNPSGRSVYRVPVAEVERILNERKAQKGKG